MVHQKTRSRQTIVKCQQSNTIFLALLCIFLITIVLAIYVIIKANLDQKNVINEFNEIIVEKQEPDIQAIDFQSVVDEWTRSVAGEKSVIIYDLDLNKMVGSYNTTKKYNTASLYKLFVVYEGYRKLETGEWKEDELVGSTGYTILECLDKSIRESYSPCAEALWAKIGHDELDEIIEKDFKITNSEISSLISNPEDVLKIMKMFYRHSDIKSENYLAVLKDSFLNQPKTTYDWRQGLPSGFSDNAKVYNKVGWEYNESGYWNIYHDTAIVEFPEKNRHFIVIVMTNRVPFQKIRELGSEIEKEFNKY